MATLYPRVKSEDTVRSRQEAAGHIREYDQRRSADEAGKMAILRSRRGAPKRRRRAAPARKKSHVPALRPT